MRIPLPIHLENLLWSPQQLRQYQRYFEGLDSHERAAEEAATVRRWQWVEPYRPQPKKDIT